MVFRPRIASSSATPTRKAVLPMPCRATTTPMFPGPSPPWIECSNNRSGFRSLSSLLYMVLLLVRGDQAGTVFLDQFLVNFRWNRSISRKLHCVFGFSLRGRTEIRRITEHFGERHLGVDPDKSFFFGRSDDDSPALHNGADKSTLEFERPFHRNFHDRFEDLRLRRRINGAECAARCRLERVVGRVDRVRGSVVDHDAEAGDRKSDQTAFPQHRLESLLDRADELLWNGAAVNLVDELEIAFHRFDVSCDASILSRAASLFFVSVIELGLAGNRFTIGNLGSARFDFGVVFALHAFDVDIEV